MNQEYSRVTIELCSCYDEEDGVYLRHRNEYESIGEVDVASDLSFAMENVTRRYATFAAAVRLTWDRGSENVACEEENAFIEAAKKVCEYWEKWDSERKEK